MKKFLAAMMTGCLLLALCLLLPRQAKAATVELGTDAAIHHTGTRAAGHTHPVCGKTCTCSGAHSSQTWQPLPTGVTTLTSGNYYLESDITFTGFNELTINGTVSICLNGKNIYKNGTSSVVDVKSGTLTLTDCVGTGKVQVVASNYNSFSGGGAVYLTGSGSLAMYGGTVSCDALGSAIYCDTTGDLTVYDGTVEGYYEAVGVYVVNDVTIHSGTFKSSNGTCLDFGDGNYSVKFHNVTIHGGYFEGKTSGAAFGKFTCSGKVTIGGGEFYGKGPVPNATTYSSDYYGLTFSNSGAGPCNLTVTDGIFRGARGGFYNYNPLLNATISGGTFHSKSTTYAIGSSGIQIENGTFLIEEGTIYGIQHSSTYSKDTTITVTGGQILCIQGSTGSTGIFTVKVYGGTIGRVGTQTSTRGISTNAANVEIYRGTITGTEYAVYHSSSTYDGSLLVAGGTLSGGTADLYMGKVGTTAASARLSMNGYTGSTVTVALPSSVAVNAYVAKNVSGSNIIALSNTQYIAAYDAANKAVYTAEPHTHTFVQNTANSKYIKSAATCTTPAIYYKSCSVCGEKGTETFEYGTSLGHTGGTATCKELAVCTRCRNAYGNLNGNNHAGGTEIRGKKAASCTVDGYTGDSWCLGCQSKVEDGKTIPAPGHDYTQDRFVCGVCGEARPHHVVRFLDHNGTQLSSQKYLPGDTVTAPAAPTRAADETYTYTFSGWDREVVACAGDATYTATYKATYIEYTVSFLDGDDRVLSRKTYHYGDEVAAPADPTKAADNTYTYTFSGWDKTVETTCKGNATYKATFKGAYIDYTVKFLDEDGKVLSEKTYHYGDEVAVPAEPTKAADVVYTYAFSGWDKTVTVCQGDVVYRAVYNSRYIDYTVTFRYEDGTVIAQQVLHYGDAVTAPTDPAVPESLGEVYAFDGWDKTVTACTGNDVYIATFVRVWAPGDVNASGTVDNDDVLWLLWHTLFGSEYELTGNADFTGDGAISNNDVLWLLWHTLFGDQYPLTPAALAQPHNSACFYDLPNQRRRML